MAIERMPEVPPPDAGQSKEIQPPTGVPRSVDRMRRFGAVSREAGAVLNASWGGEGTVPQKEVKAQLVLHPEVFENPFRAEGRTIAREFVDLMALPYEEKYNQQNSQRIRELVVAWKDWIERKRERFTTRKPFKEPDTTIEPEQQYEAQDLTGLSPATELAEVFLDMNSTQDEKNAAVEGLSKYFQTAKSLGLLRYVDDRLRGIYADMTDYIDQGLSIDEAEESTTGRVGFKARLENIKRLGRSAFRGQSPQLNGVWEAYIDLTYENFLRGIDPTRGEAAGRWGITGEYSHEEERRGEYAEMARHKEVFWRPTYANYYEVTARTEDQFNTAMESFVQWARRALSKDPNEVFAKLQGFKEAVTTAGVRADVSTTELRYQLEALVGVMGGDWANEHYNADHYYQFLWSATKDEGPERFVSLSKMGKGRLAALLWKLDNDPRFELYFAMYGSRGEFVEDENAIEMLRMQDQIADQLTEEALGMQLKAYDLGDPQKRLKEEFPDGRDPYKDNLDYLVMFQPDEQFRQLFDGFDIPEQDRLLQELAIRAERVKRAKELDELFKQGEAPVMDNEDRLVYQQWQAGQLRLAKSEQQTLNHLAMASEIRRKLREGVDPSELKGAERSMYEDARNTVDLTLELYGVMGEKGRRGATFIVDRVDGNGKKFHDYIPIHWAEKFVQFSENWTKATYGGELTPDIQEKIGRERLGTAQYDQLEAEFHDPSTPGGRRRELEGILRPKGISAAELKIRVDQARRMAIWQLKTYGYQAELYDFTFLQDRRPLDANTLGYTKWGVDETKTNIMDKYRYAVPKNARILGYNSQGQQVFLTFNPDGSLAGLEWDNAGKAVVYDKDPKQGGKRIEFDNLTSQTRAEKMRLKTPGPNGTVRQVPVNFEIATGRDKRYPNVYWRWTGHPYWGYQEEDTGMVLTRQAYEEARKIRDGLIRPEDAHPHAVQRLLVDPTLQRMSQFPHRRNRRDAISLAAVEESYQGHFRIQRELHEAFYPEDADNENNRIDIIIQDFGGTTQELLQARAFQARWTNMKMRRLRTFLPYTPLNWASMSEMWGAGSALGVLQMMNKRESEYRMVGQFPLEKWVNGIMPAQRVLDTIWGFRNPQEHKSEEGVGEKPNNDADALEQYFGDFSKGEFGHLKGVGTTHEDKDNVFVNAVRKSLGRFEQTLKALRVLETDVRSERGPWWLEGIDIFERNPDGSLKMDADNRPVFNKAVESSMDTGTSRHSGDLFFWQFVRWLRSEKPREGEKLYPSSAKYYAVMDLPTIESLERTEHGKHGHMETKWEWLLGKLNR